MILSNFITFPHFLILSKAVAERSIEVSKKYPPDKTIENLQLKIEDAISN
jgi:hypothetical protein